MNKRVRAVKCCTLKLSTFMSKCIEKTLKMTLCGSGGEWETCLTAQNLFDNSTRPSSYEIRQSCFPELYFHIYPKVTC